MEYLFSSKLTPVPIYTAWWTEVHVCEQLAQSRYVKRSGRDSNLLPISCKCDALTTTSPHATVISYCQRLFHCPHSRPIENAKCRCPADINNPGNGYNPTDVDDLGYFRISIRQDSRHRLRGGDRAIAPTPLAVFMQGLGRLSLPKWKSILIGRLQNRKITLSYTTLREAWMDQNASFRDQLDQDNSSSDAVMGKS